MTLLVRLNTFGADFPMLYQAILNTVMPDALRCLAIWLKTSGVWVFWERLRGALYSYERAWIHYACHADHPVAMSTWIERFPEFAKAAKSPLFRKAYTL